MKADKSQLSKANRIVNGDFQGGILENSKSKNAAADCIFSLRAPIQYGECIFIIFI